MVPAIRFLFFIGLIALVLYGIWRWVSIGARRVAYKEQQARLKAEFHTRKANAKEMKKLREQIINEDLDDEELAKWVSDNIGILPAKKAPKKKVTKK